MTNLDTQSTETLSGCGRIGMDESKSDGSQRICYRSDKTGYECQYCDEPFDYVSCRQFCPNCKTKNTCCE